MISHWEGGRKFPAGWGGDARGEGKVEGRGSGKGGGRSRHREKKWSLGGTKSGGDDGAECRVGSFGSGTGGSSGPPSCLGGGGDPGGVGKVGGEGRRKLHQGSQLRWSQCSEPKTLQMAMVPRLTPMPPGSAHGHAQAAYPCPLCDEACSEEGDTAVLLMPAAFYDLAYQLH